ncbi:site-specific integrase [Candidatus Bathyarchaeota archaeon]|nr:site-specific integrase [Candidatus Bathyarchaeota archaeon]
MTPRQVFEARHEEVSSRDPLKMGRVRDMVVEIMRELNDGDFALWPEDAKAVLISRNQMSTLKKRAAGTCRQMSKAMTYFFDTFGEAYEIRIKPKDKPRGDSAGQKYISVDDLAEATRHGGRENPQRNTAILLFLKDIGIRRGDLPQLTVGDYKEARVSENEDGEPFKAWRDLRTVKMGITARIHQGPESIEAIDRYLRVEHPDPSPESPLFMQSDKRLMGRGIEPNGPISGGAAGLVVKRMIRLAMGPDAYKRSAHSLRKFHKTRLEAAGVDEDWILIMQGKAPDEYSVPPDRDLMEAYMRGYDELRVFKADSPQLSKLRFNLTKRIEELEGQLAGQIQMMDYALGRLDAAGVPVHPGDPVEVRRQLKIDIADNLLEYNLLRSRGDEEQASQVEESLKDNLEELLKMLRDGRDRK